MNKPDITILCICQIIDLTHQGALGSSLSCPHQVSGLGLSSAQQHILQHSKSLIDYVVIGAQ